MKYPLFASIVILALLLMYEIRKHRKKESDYYQSIVDKEILANSTRRKPLDDLDYICIPFEQLPMDTIREDERVAEYQDILRRLSEAPIVNLTGISNTDLKLRYGAPNIDTLMRYDQSYTMLVRTLYEWGTYLLKLGQKAAAQSIFEYAVSIKTDVSDTYTQLAKFYAENENYEAIKGLIQTASELNSLMKDSIIANLEKYILPDLSGLE